MSRKLVARKFNYVLVQYVTNPKSSIAHTSHHWVINDREFHIDMNDTVVFGDPASAMPTNIWQGRVIRRANTVPARNISNYRIIATANQKPTVELQSQLNLDAPAVPDLVRIKLLIEEAEKALTTLKNVVSN